ncbi:MAG: hypothetical protein AAF560_04315 [Acidobacteriota bacterium]
MGLAAGTGAGNFASAGLANGISNVVPDFVAAGTDCGSDPGTRFIRRQTLYGTRQDALRDASPTRMDCGDSH